MNLDFPQYRKLSNDKSYYKICSVHQMQEVQVSGSRFSVHELHAKILPERLLITDILNNDNGHFLTISEQEYQEFVAHCDANLRKF